MHRIREIAAGAMRAAGDRYPDMEWVAGETVEPTRRQV